jgi:hypothetical protein
MAFHMSAGVTQCLNCGLLQDHVVVYGILTNIPHANFPYLANSPPAWGEATDLAGRPIDRSYARFMCADTGADDAYKWFDDGAFSDPPDGDINFDVDISAFPDKYDNAMAALYALRTPDGHPLVHSEMIMYGRHAYADDDNGCAGNVPTLLPGWADRGANSVLIDSRPMNGFDANRVQIAHWGDYGDCSGIVYDDGFNCWATAMPGWTPHPGDIVRITGVLAKDEHTTWNDPGIEIHPVYAIDVIRPARQGDLTGVWAADDRGTYYIRQVRDAQGHDMIWWLGLSKDRGRTFANVFRGTVIGTIAGAFVQGEWADVPLGATRGSGELNVTLPDPVTLNYAWDTGGFGARRWEKLYDVP